MPLSLAALNQARTLLQERDLIASVIGKSSVSLGPNKGYSEGEGLLGSMGQLSGRKRWALSALTGITPQAKAAKQRLEAQAKENGRPFRVEVLRVVGNTDTELKATTAALKEAKAQLLDTERQLTHLQQEFPELKNMSLEDIQSSIDLETLTGDDAGTTTDNTAIRIADESATQETHDAEVDQYLNNQS